VGLVYNETGPWSPAVARGLPEAPHILGPLLAGNEPKIVPPPLAIVVLVVLDFLENLASLDQQRLGSGFLAASRHQTIQPAGARAAGERFTGFLSAWSMTAA